MKNLHKFLLIPATLFVFFTGGCDLFGPTKEPERQFFELNPSSVPYKNLDSLAILQVLPNNDSLTLDTWTSKKADYPSEVYLGKNTKPPYHIILKGFSEGKVVWAKDLLTNSEGGSPTSTLITDKFVLPDVDIVTDTTDPLAILVDLPSKIYSENGKAKTLSVTYAGEATNFVWIKDGFTIPGENKEKLSISKTDSTSAGIYKLKISNEKNTLFSQPCTLVVLTKGYTVQVIKNGKGGLNPNYGSSFFYPTQKPLNLQVTPDKHWVLSQVKINNQVNSTALSEGAIKLDSITQNTQINLSFSEKTYQVQILSNPPNSAAFDLQPIKKSYTVNDSLSLLAQPKEGYTFVQWDDSSKSSERGFKISSLESKIINDTLTLNAFLAPKLDIIGDLPIEVFLKIGDTLKLSAAIDGIVDSIFWTQNGKILEGQTSNQLVVPNVSDSSAGEYQVVFKNSEGSKLSSKCKVSIVATGYTLTLITNGSGKTNPSLSKENFLPTGKGIQFSLIPNSGSQLTSVLVNDVPDTQAVKTKLFKLDSITKNTTVILNFEKSSFVVVAQANNDSMGTVSKIPFKLNYTKGETVKIYAQAKAGYRLGGWAKSDSKNDTLPVVVDASSPYILNDTIRVTALFELLKLGIVNQPSNGINPVLGSPFSLVVEYSGKPTSFVWTKDGIEIPNQSTATFSLASFSQADTGSYTLTLKNATDSVTSAPIKVVYSESKVKLSYSQTGEGSIVPYLPTDTPSFFSLNSKLIFVLKPKVGYKIGPVNQFDPAIELKNDSIIIHSLSSDASLSVEFVPEKYTLTVTSYGAGDVSINPKKDFYAYDDEVTLTATPGKAMRFFGWEGSSEKTNTISITITKNTALRAIFVDILSCTDLSPTNTGIQVELNKIYSSASKIGTLCPAPGKYTDPLEVLGKIQVQVR